MRSFSFSCAALAAVGLPFLLPTVAEANPPPYTLVGSFPLSGDAFDILPDGRIVTISGSTISMQSAINGSAYAAIGSVSPGLVSSFGASFLRVSPSGSSIAIGDNNFGSGASVLLVSSASLNTIAPSSAVSIASPNSEAVWSGESTLFVSGFGSGPIVSRIDVASAITTTVITGIGDGSGGVALSGSRLFVGLGYDASGGSHTGDVRAFDLASVSGDSSTGFSSGIQVARALSASSLSFDSLGNLIIGGGDFFSGSGDFGYAAVVDGASIEAALAGGAFAPDSAETRLSPAGSNAFYGARFNPVTQEVLVIADGTAYRYAIPAPSGVALFAMMAFASRRRRHA